LCGIKWSNTNGKCNSCSDQFQFVLATKECLEYCKPGFTRDEDDGKCKELVLHIIFRWAGYIVGIISAAALIYKMHLYLSLKRHGKLKNELSVFQGIFAVIAYGSTGNHIVNTNHDEMGGLDQGLLHEERRQNVIEMRGSICEFLDEADLGEFRPHFSQLGVNSTADLELVDDDDLEGIGIPLIQRKKFKFAKEKRNASLSSRES